MSKLRISSKAAVKEEKVPGIAHLQMAKSSKNFVCGTTAFVYDEDMVKHRCLWSANNPDLCQGNFDQVLDKCREYGLIQRCAEIKPGKVNKLLKFYTMEPNDLLQEIDGITDSSETLEFISSRFDSINIHPSSTNNLPQCAARSTEELVDAILQRKVQNGMAINSPPGHLLMKGECCLYGFYNNVAVAAQHALDKGVKKILIVDWDVYHGQASQKMFYDDPRVLYFSVHRFENGSCWPNLRESDFHYIGHGAGKGFNVNVPLNQTKMCNADYMAIWHQLLLPLAYEYEPELVLVSAGYNSALGCSEGEMEVTPAFYAHLTSSLMGLAEGKLVVVVEGGQCLKSQAEGAALTLRMLLGDPCPAVESLREPSQSVRDTILSTICMIRSHWKCFPFQGHFPVPSSGEITSPENKFLPKITFLESGVKKTTLATWNGYPVQSKEPPRILDDRLDNLIKSTNLKVACHRVCFVYDERMTLHHSKTDRHHVEKPGRITSIYELLLEYGVIDRCLRVQARDATRKELLWLHDAEYLDKMENSSTMTQADLNKMSRGYGSIYMSPGTQSSALLSAGSALQIVESILSGESRSGIGVIRPPGHHAESGEAYGFCFYNNTALAANYALENHHLERILIVDWDIHHGNGIQRMFEKDPRVLYLSLHRLDLFPQKPEEAGCHVIGTGAGAGYTVNIAWPQKGMGDSEYLAAFQQVVMPIAYQYNPQLVLVAAGFDAAKGDPLGECEVTPEGYGQMTHFLTSLANGRVAILLEGGYNLDSISHSMVMCTKALLGDPLPAPKLKPITKSGLTTIKRVVNHLRKYWTSLRFHVDLPKQTDVVRP